MLVLVHVLVFVFVVLVSGCLPGQPADLVVCDGAPDVTGLHDIDEYIQVCRSAATSADILYSTDCLRHICSKWPRDRRSL